MINRKLFLSISAIAILYAGCGEDKTTTKSTPVLVEEKSVTTIDKVANSVITQVESTAKKAEQLARDVQESTSPVVKNIANKVKDVQKEISETTLEDAKTKITEVTAPIIKKVQQSVITPDANVLYKKCAGCHGQNAEKKALNKSAIIKDLKKEQIEEALKGYKMGTYGGAMKGIMQSQVANITDKEIEVLSQHISNFK